MVISATYRGGVFVPSDPCDLPDGARVDLRVQEASVTPPLVTDPEERRRLLREVVELAKANPIPANAPRFTRDELYDRG